MFEPGCGGTRIQTFFPGLRRWSRLRNSTSPAKAFSERTGARLAQENRQIENPSPVSIDRNGIGSSDLGEFAQRRLEDLAGLPTSGRSISSSRRIGEGAGDADADRTRPTEQRVRIGAAGMALASTSPLKVSPVAV